MLCAAVLLCCSCKLLLLCAFLVFGAWTINVRFTSPMTMPKTYIQRYGKFQTPQYCTLSCRQPHLQIVPLHPRRQVYTYTSFLEAKFTFLHLLGRGRNGSAISRVVPRRGLFIHRQTVVHKELLILHVTEGQQQHLHAGTNISTRHMER